jgi:NADPH:quinone reductase-like Zn-dependent oxidoreductase
MINSTMKAVICTKYGPPEVLQIQRIPVPIPEDNEILIKIRASSVNSGDVRVRGLVVEGFLKVVMRFVLGFSKPRKPILGTVFSGEVEQIGKKVTDFKPGDHVFGVTGFRFGTFAEYIAVSHDSTVAIKPANATFEEAAAIPFGGHTAIHFLQKAKIQERKNPKVMIYGATGSVGAAAIQIARHYNANVTAVCSENGLPLVSALGADRIILYNKEDFTKSTEKYDIIFDAVGKTSRQQCQPLLAEGGCYKTVGGLEVAAERKEQLYLLRELFESGKYNAAIDKVYSIDEIVEAHRYVEAGRKKGNVVLKIA